MSGSMLNVMGKSREVSRMVNGNLVYAILHFQLFLALSSEVYVIMNSQFRLTSKTRGGVVAKKEPHA